MGDARIPDDWLGGYCHFSVCWPNSPQWLAVLRGTLSIPQEGRFWDETSGEITVAQDVIEETFDYNFRNEVVIMACNDDVASALQAIAVALTVGGSGGSSGNQACYNRQTMDLQSILNVGGGEVVQIYGSEPVTVLPEAGFPDGYSDLEQYEADKCAKANKLVVDFAATMRNMGNVEWGLSAVTAVAILGCLVGIITVPEVVIPTLVWILLSGVTLTTACLALATWVEDNRQTVVCMLYETDGTEALISVFSDIMSVAIAAIAVEGAVALALKQLAMLLLSTDTVNQIFTSKAKEIYPDADCSSCDEEGFDRIEIPAAAGGWEAHSVAWGEEVTIEFNALTSSGFYYAEMRIVNPSSDNPDDYTFTVTAATLGNSGGCVYQYTGLGVYGPENWDEQGFLSWEFGCTNLFATSVTGTFNKS